jgi:hypothetical protein
MVSQIRPKYGYIAATWTDESQQHPDGGALACAIRSKEGVDASGVHSQADIANGRFAAKQLRNRFGGDHKIPH